MPEGHTGFFGRKYKRCIKVGISQVKSAFKMFVDVTRNMFMRYIKMIEKQMIEYEISKIIFANFEENANDRK